MLGNDNNYRDSASSSEIASPALYLRTNLY